MQMKWLATALWCSSVFAQSAPTDVFQKAPPHIEEALRGRVTEFLQAHVDGKFRLANEVVAEDSKDTYFAMEKHRYLGFEIVKIDYTDNYTKATVLSTVEVNWRPSARFPNQRVKAPYKTLWKVEDGKWFWHTVNTGKWETPWGEMKVSGEAPKEEDPAAQVLSQIKNMNGKAILNQVSVNKRDVVLKCCENSSDTVEITNGMQGPISLRLESSPVVGLDMKLDRTDLKQGETAKLSFTYAPPTKQAKPNAVAAVRVEPLGTRLPFDLSFSLPPEVQKQLPKQQ